MILPLIEALSRLEPVNSQAGQHLPALRVLLNGFHNVEDFWLACVMPAADHPYQVCFISLDVFELPCPTMSNQTDPIIQ